MKRSLGPRTLLLPTPVIVVGTYDDKGQANAMTAAWGGICCSKPPCVTVSLRKATYSYGAIMARKAYTLHITDEALMRQADFLGMASGRDGDKLETLDLAHTKSEVVDAPIIDAFPLVLECKVVHVQELGLHTMFVGEVLDVKADERVLNEKNHLVMESLQPIAFIPEVRTYHGLGPALGRAFDAGKSCKPEMFKKS